MKITLIKNRRYTGLDTASYFNTPYAVATFSVKEQLETESEGFTETQWDGIEHYGKGIGLVYYKKEINPGFTLEYGLFDTYPPESAFPQTPD